MTASTDESNIITPRQDRVLYLAHNSLPYHSAGYATRTQGLISGGRRRGYDIHVVTRLGYPQSFLQFRTATIKDREDIDDVPYHRLSMDVSRLFGLSTHAYINLNVAATTEFARSYCPSVVHGASNFINGLTAVHVARQIGVPSIYEVRGLWEITALSRDQAYHRTLRFAQATRLETEACLAADRVITITDGLKRELVGRGVPADKIVVVPNGVDTHRFRPRPRDMALAARLGIAATDVVVGYVGSILDYEGIDDMLRATRVCLDNGLDKTRVLIVGCGAVYDSCVSLAHELNLEDHVIFTGRVPHKAVEDYYSLIDVTPFPRKPLPVCEMVSPLKPFEAMAMGKCVIVSSVAALTEIIGDHPIGLVHEKGDVADLAACVTRAVQDKALRDRLGANARDHVVAERDWYALAIRLAMVYEDLT